MHQILDDCAKRRLTERDDILTAVNIMRSRGCRNDDLLFEITKVFYVDLDAFNTVVKSNLSS